MSVAGEAAAGLAHGLLWKAVSVGARLAFVILIVPHMIGGQYGLYFTLSTFSLIVAQVCAMGSQDYIPTLVRSDERALTKFSHYALGPFLLSCVLALAALITELLWVAILALVLSMSAGAMLAGATRSLKPAWFERYSNVIPLSLLSLSLVSGPGLDAVRLLALQAASVVLGQSFMVWPQASNMSLRKCSSSFAEIGRLWTRRAGAVMASDLLTLGCVRGVAVGPWILGRAVITDALALSLAIGEAMWSVGLAVINRNYSYYCSAGVHRGRLKWTVAIIGAVTLGVAFAALIAIETALLPESVPQRLVDARVLVPALLFFGAVLVASELKYVDMALGLSMRRWLIGQSAFTAFSACAIPIFGEAMGLWAMFCVLFAVAGALCRGRLGAGPQK